MAVTITVAEIAEAIRLDNPDDVQTRQLTALLASSEAWILRFAPGAPDAVQNQAAVQLVGYYYDAPTSSARAGLGNAPYHSGASALLAQWREHRAGVIE